MSRRVVQHHNRDPFQAKGQPLQLLHNETGIDSVFTGASLLVSKRQALVRESKAKQFNTIQSASFVAGHKNFLALKLPGIRHARLQRHAALITVKQVNPATLTHRLQQAQAFNSKLLNLRERLTAGTFGIRL